MKHESKQKSQEQEQLATAAQQATTREFATAEELLRHDATQTEVPLGIAERLTKSIQNLPRPSKTWWQRLLKR